MFIPYNSNRKFEPEKITSFSISNSCCKSTTVNVVSKTEKLAQEAAFSVDEYLEELRKYEIVYTEGDVDNGAVPVGQTVGLINSYMDVDDIVAGFTKEAEKILKNLCTTISWLLKIAYKFK